MTVMNSLLLATLIFASGELEHRDNFAENPSFESDRDRDTLPDGWRPYAFESPAQLVWDARTSRTGDRSLRISDSFRADDQRDWKRCTGRWVSRRRPIHPGTEYQLSVWVKTEGVTGQAYAHLAWQRGTNWLSEVGTQRLSGTNDWQQLTVTATAPADADSVVISMNLARSKGTAWFDDAVVSGRSDVPPVVEYVFRETEDWFPFTFPLDDTNLDTIDLTGYLDAPAGKHGFVTVRDDGHFYFEDGKRREVLPSKADGGVITLDPSQAKSIWCEVVAE